MNSKELLKGTLSTIILTLLREKGKMYGYEITQEVKRRTDGKILLREGSLYPALHRMLADGLLVTEEVMIGRRPRIYYKLTEQGAQQTTDQTRELLDFLNTIGNLLLPGNIPAHG